MINDELKTHFTAATSHFIADQPMPQRSDAPGSHGFTRWQGNEHGTKKIAAGVARWPVGVILVRPRNSGAADDTVTQSSPN